MNQIELLVKQTTQAYDWANKLLAPVPHTVWETIPATIDTNITWQAGHLVVSFYYHTIMVITGHQQDVLQQIPLKEYSQLFTLAPPANAAGKTTPEQLLQHLSIVERKSLEIIASLSPDELTNELVPSSRPHPVAKTKQEALEWNIQHTFWHCGQIALLKRVVDQRYDFGWRGR
jgi:hypothetical protein